MHILPTLLLALLLMDARAVGQGFHEREPTRYRQAAAANAATALDQRLAAGEVELPVEGPRGRLRARLGALDLRDRVFVLPLSPMVHAPAFAALPDELRRRAIERLHLVLDKGRFPGGVRMTTEQRFALRDHLRATLAGW